MSSVPEIPEVILDVIFEDGLLFLSIQNISARPALNVSVTFAKPLFGLEGKREISALPLFRQLTFLAPHKEIRTFLDTSASWFARRQPAVIDALIAFRDNTGAKFESAVRHDLRIYRDIGYVRQSSATSVEVPPTLRI